ncbi:hypothetical protein NM208_g11831 [Fusarium decemcellulare]|uniref:Uncharacterized protein n=1 Tax=Fusarium decemcellulare TaxID=57161 RepID=A0ACC1RTL6_9HYPO|nr:hypothetical protein NM208_g11831 [Fusarium decemcellulare]
MQQRRKTAIQVFTPALDILRSRPADAAHSENTSLVKRCQKILFDIIIQPQHNKSFLHDFQAFSLPKTWKRVQNPVTHMDSWRMIEAGQASIVMPVILRNRLNDKHIRQDLLPIILSSAPEFLGATFNDSFTASELLEGLLEYCPFKHACLRSLPTKHFPCRVHGQSSSRKTLDAFRVPHIIQEESWCRLSENNSACQAAEEETSDTTRFNVGDWKSSLKCWGGGWFYRQVSERYRSRAGCGESKADAYDSLKGLPNIHAGLHLWDVARAFGACRHIYTLLSEDIHKAYKRQIPKINNRNIASTMILQDCVYKTILFGILGSFRFEFPQVHDAFMQGILGITEEGDEEDGDVEIREDDKHQRPLLGTESIKWAKRPSFRPGPNLKRVCFPIGDFIVVRDGQIARLDGIFKHCIMKRDYRVFLVVTHTSNKTNPRKDGVLDCPVYDITGEQSTVGLPALSPQQEWIIERKDGTVLYAPYDGFFI